MGAPLEDARHLTQRYERLRQEAEAQVCYPRYIKGSASSSEQHHCRMTLGTFCCESLHLSLELHQQGIRKPATNCLLSYLTVTGNRAIGV